MGIGVFVLLTRGLSPARFGVLATVLGIAQMATVPFDAALEPVHVRETQRRPGIEAAFVHWAGRTRLVAGAALSVALALAGPVLVGDDHMPTLLVALAVLPVGWLFAANPVLVRGRALGALAAIGLLQGAVWLAAVAALTMRDAPLPAFAAAYVGSVTVQGLAARGLARRHREQIGGVTLGLRSFLRHLRPGAGLALVAVVGVVYFKLDTVLLLRFRGAAEAGEYALAFRVLEQAAIVPLTLRNVFSPRILKAHPGSPDLARAFGEYVRTALLVSVPLVVVGVLVAEPFVRLLFGERYIASVTLLRALLPAFVLICLGYVLAAVAMSAGRTGRQAAIAVTALVVNLGLNLALVPDHGAAAAAAATVVTEAVVVVGLYLAVRSVPGVRVPWAWTVRLLAVVGAAAGASFLAPSPVIGAACFAASFAALAVPAGLVSARDLRAGRVALGWVR